MPASQPSPPQAVATALSVILQDALKALAEAGEADAACQLAARACAALRHDEPALWRRFNALLHRIAPHSSPVGAGGGTGRNGASPGDA